MKQTLKLFAISMFVAGFFAVIKAPTASAATFNVVAGTDNITVNSQCELSEALQNVLDGLRTNTDCIEVGTYGTDDTIILPNGTITLTANLPTIDASVKILGQNSGTSAINGATSYRVFQNINDSSAEVSIENLKIEAWSGYAIKAENSTSLTLKNIELDGTNAAVGSDGAIQIGQQSSGTNTFDAENIYIHDITGNSSYIHIFNVWNTAGAVTNATVKNITISNISNTGGVNTMVWGVGVMSTNNTYGTLNGRISNTTITDITSPVGANSIIGFALVSASGQQATTNLEVANSTITKVSSGPSIFGFTGTYGLMAASQDNTNLATNNFRSTNVVFAENTVEGVPATCMTASGNAIFGGTGPIVNNLTSNGGNLTDDTTCSSYFTHSTDQNNIGTLSSTLGTFSNNGGFVPTIPLLANSPAVDAGVTVAGLTQDARLASRPQGSAFDSGAYESPFTRTQATTVSTALAGTGSDAMLILASSLSLIGTGAGYLLLKFKQSRS